ncbi:Protein kinase domain-containing protein [Aphelenchoides bicaudatus]|nr:Protein kinase domain-containing protein [Aphelenchoides bicaudatus]
MTTTIDSPMKTEDESKIKLEVGQKYGGWKILRKLDEGGFGQVYIVTKKGALAALKSESNDIEGEQPHIPYLYHAAKKKRFCYMVCTLLGDNLRTLRLGCKDEKFKPETWSRLAIQCLYSIKLLHDVGFVHRDIKPANFVLGHNKDPKRARLIHILDFGLARSFACFRDGNWVARRARRSAEFRGTVRYCSSFVHLREEQGRKDDIWSLMYMLIELHCGLPWQRERNKEVLERRKLNTPDSVLLKYFPIECHIIVAHLRELDCYNRPDYLMISECFIQLVKKYKVDFSTPYDWEDPAVVEEIIKVRTKKPDYENPAKFFAYDPLRINKPPPKGRGSSSNVTRGAPTVEENKDMFAQVCKQPSNSSKPGK